MNNIFCQLPYPFTLQDIERATEGRATAGLHLQAQGPGFTWNYWPLSLGKTVYAVENKPRGRKPTKLRLSHKSPTAFLKLVEEKEKSYANTSKPS